MKRGVSNTPAKKSLPPAVDAALPALPKVDPIFPSRAIVPADQHPAAVYFSRLAPGSRHTMRSALQWISATLSRGAADVETFPWPTLRAQHVGAIRQLLVDSGRAPATVNRYLAALRGVLGACWRLGLLDADLYHRAIDVPPARGSRLPRGRALTLPEISALFTSCRRDPDPWRGARDAALLALLFGAGLRRAEAAALVIGDAQRAGVRVLGKGNKERLVPLPPGALHALRWWIQHRGSDPGPLLLPLGGPARHVTPQAIYMMLARRARWAGVRAFSPHDLRRSYVSQLLDAGVDLSLVRGLAGHAQVQTTMRYDRRDQVSLAHAAARLRVPF